MTAKYLNESLIDLENHIDIKKKFLKMKIRKKWSRLLKKPSTLINNKKVKDFLWTYLA